MYFIGSSRLLASKWTRPEREKKIGSTCRPCFFFLAQKCLKNTRVFRYFFARLDDLLRNPRPVKKYIYFFPSFDPGLGPTGQIKYILTCKDVFYRSQSPRRRPRLSVVVNNARNFVWATEWVAPPYTHTCCVC